MYLVLTATRLETCDDNLRLNTDIYDFEFPDRQVENNAADVIAKTRMTHVNNEEFSLR